MPKRSKGVLEASIEHERSIARAIGDRMRERRIQLELSQGTVRAKLKTAGIHISRSQYSRIEQGESLLNAAEIIALTHTLDMSCQWLLMGVR